MSLLDHMARARYKLLKDDLVPVEWVVHYSRRNELMAELHELYEPVAGIQEFIIYGAHVRFTDKAMVPISVRDDRGDTYVVLP